MHTHTISRFSPAPSTWVRRWLLLLLVASGFSSFAQSIGGPDYVYANITRNPNGATTNYTTDYTAGVPAMPFNGANLGIYTLGGTSGDDQLPFQGGRITTIEPTSTNANVRFKSAQLYYRVYVQGNAGTAGYSSLALPEDITSIVANSNGTTTRVFDLNSTTTNIDLIGAVSGAGTFTVEVYLEATYQNANGGLTVIRDDRGGLNYQAGFIVRGARAFSTTWQGNKSDNWFDASNWSAGLPSATVDAFIQYPSAGTPNPYPAIYANGPYRSSNTTYNQLYSGATYGSAIVRNLSFGGTAATARATAELASGNLLIYGTLTNSFDNITQDGNTTITFAGTANTDIIGGGTFWRIHIAGGGTKTLTGNMLIAEELHFGSPLVGGTGILAVNGSNSSNVVTLQPTTVPNQVARITGETNTSYVSGLVKTQITATPGMTQDFGNIGLSLAFAGNDPGTVTINRTIGQYFNGPNANNPNSVSIKRSFEVNTQNANTDAYPLTATLVFKYLENERKNVGANRTNVNEQSLYLAYSRNSTSFTSIGNVVGQDTVNNTLTAANVNAFAIFTLADTQNPLPVSLVAFTAKRVGENALITWATAMERDNRGFEVEVSTDGINFRTLGFVASNSPDSNKRLEYTFSDAEANKSGIRYYRLHQLDISGKDDYSPVRAVSFAAAGEGIAALSAYPNPFSSDEIKLALQSSEAGQASLRVTDLTGRPVSNQTFAAVKGVTEVSIDKAAQLAAGSYLAQITAPSGEVKTIRIQKR
ncbi:MAG: T9SS type A sorting domain-containing protein [Hymenobacter sp.]|nr:MAG: T9SS type A sorting domain-containing protein [Hymenobacter sp.]